MARRRIIGKYSIAWFGGAILRLVKAVYVTEIR
jgi:hypothetical protein